MNNKDLEKIKMLADISAILYADKELAKKIKENWWKVTKEMKSIWSNIKKEYEDILERYKEIKDEWELEILIKKVWYKDLK